MIVAAPLVMFLTPMLPPSGPIFGQIECLFGAGEAQEAAMVRFNESGVPRQSMVVFLQEDTPDPQAELFQFPVDGNRLTDLEFKQDGNITIHSNTGSGVAGNFRPLQRSGAGERWWMEFSVPDATGSMKSVGQCLAEFNGRLERPIRLTKINTIRVDIEKP